MSTSKTPPSSPCAETKEQAESARSHRLNPGHPFDVKAQSTQVRRAERFAIRTATSPFTPFSCLGPQPRIDKFIRPSARPPAPTHHLAVDQIGGAEWPSTNARTCQVADAHQPPPRRGSNQRWMTDSPAPAGLQHDDLGTVRQPRHRRIRPHRHKGAPEGETARRVGPFLRRGCGSLTSRVRVFR